MLPTRKSARAPSRRPRARWDPVPHTPVRREVRLDERLHRRLRDVQHHQGREHTHVADQGQPSGRRTVRDEHGRQTEDEQDAARENDAVQRLPQRVHVPAAVGASDGEADAEEAQGGERAPGDQAQARPVGRCRQIGRRGRRRQRGAMWCSGRSSDLLHGRVGDAERAAVTPAVASDCGRVVRPPAGCRWHGRMRPGRGRVYRGMTCRRRSAATGRRRGAGRTDDEPAEQFTGRPAPGTGLAAGVDAGGAGRGAGRGADRLRPARPAPGPGQLDAVRSAVGGHAGHPRGHRGARVPPAGSV